MLQSLFYYFKYGYLLTASSEQEVEVSINKREIPLDDNNPKDWRRSQADLLFFKFDEVTVFLTLFKRFSLN